MDSLNNITSPQKSLGASPSVTPVAIADPSSSETFEFENNTFRNLFPSNSEYPELFKHLASILDLGIISGKGVPSKDLKPAEEIYVNLVSKKQHLHAAVYSPEHGIIPLTLERRNDRISKDAKNFSSQGLSLRFELKQNTKLTSEEKKGIEEEIAKLVLTQADRDTLRERAHCSAVFLIPVERLKLDGKKVNEEKEHLDYAFQKCDKSRNATEETLEQVSIMPQSFAYVLIPKRYEEQSKLLKETLEKQGCQLRFVPDKDAKEMNLYFHSQPLDGSYTDYHTALEEIYDSEIAKQENYATVNLILHATRSHEESKTYRG